MSHYSDAYILGSGNTTVSDIGTAAATNNGKKLIIEKCVSFTDCISDINNTKIGNAKYTDIVMPMYNLIIIW